MSRLGPTPSHLPCGLLGLGSLYGTPWAQTCSISPASGPYPSTLES